MSNRKPGPPFTEQGAPYEPNFRDGAPVGDLNGTPRPANFEKNTEFFSAGYPVHMTQSSGLLKRCEPILTPSLLVSRYLKGIPLAFPNGDSFSSEDLKDQIVLATNEAELLCRITINREQFTDRVPWDSNLYKTYIHLKTEQNPVLAVQDVSIVSNDGYKVFTIPHEWIESSNFAKGIVNIIPILGAFSVASGSAAFSNYGGVPYLLSFSQINFLPGFWQISYQTGTSKIEGQYPVIINDLIGTIAAINMLSAIMNLFINTSQSQSRDGISQSSSGPGTRIYLPYIELLEKKRDVLVGKIKTAFSTRMLVTNV
jgi:hypothetical protein